MQMVTEPEIGSHHAVICFQVKVATMSVMFLFSVFLSCLDLVLLNVSCLS